MKILAQVIVFRVIFLRSIFLNEISVYISTSTFTKICRATIPFEFHNLINLLKRSSKTIQKLLNVFIIVQ